MFLKILTRILIILFLFPYLLCAEEKKQINTVECIGRGVIIEKNDQKAKEEAIADALSASVEKVTSNILAQPEEIKNFQLLNSVIYTKSDSFIESYKILAETSTADFYVVMISADVLKNKIYESLMNTGILLEKKRPIRIMLFIHGRNNKTDEADPSENRCKEMSSAQIPVKISLRERDFIVMDYITDDSSLTCSDKEILENTNNSIADVIVIGHSSVEQTSNSIEGGAASYLGAIYLKAYNPETKNLIAEAFKESIAIDSSSEAGFENVIFQAGSKAGDDIALKINKKWNEKKRIAQNIKLAVKGTDELKNFVMFRAALKDIPGVSSLKIDKMMQNSADISIDYEGNAKSLANILILKTFDAFAITISDIADNYLTVDLTPISRSR